VADDLFQETWLAAIDQISQFDAARGELRGWLFGIARRRVALYWRQRMARDAVAIAVDGAVVTESPDGGQLPDEVLEHVERGAVVQALMLVLPADRRDVLTDKYVNGLSVEQIAAKTGRSAKAVESLLARARSQLRTLCGRYFNEHGVVE
jgi:RNA polymerase sigma-70 factor (ECF subfamily)